MAINSSSASYITYILETDYPFLYEAVSGLLSDDRGTKGYSTADVNAFIKEGTIEGVTSPPGPGTDLIKLDLDDPYSVLTWTQVVASYVMTAASFEPEEIYAAYASFVKTKENKTIQPTAGDVLTHFTSDLKYFYEKQATVFLFCMFASDRLELWHRKVNEEGVPVGGEEGLVELENEEQRTSSETEQEFVPDYLGESELSQRGELQLRAVMQRVYNGFAADEIEERIKKFVFRRVTTEANPFDNTREFAETTGRISSAFFRVFSGLNPAALGEGESGLSAANLTSVFNKIWSSGLIELASYAYDIAEFAKRRFASKARLQESLIADNEDVIKEEVDLAWLSILTRVVQQLRSDAIGFAAISFYFPSLITFLLDALAATGDYTNNGQGGGGEEDVEAFINSLEQAFGIAKDGQAIFQMAFKTSNTSERINAVLKNAPFRPNIAPETPDIFHLRLGAANFYVPPITIDVNSAFKTGSLTGGSIRQKNSPKFNAGYRETSVRMRLFFPNYEEIWGIQIDDASSLSVNSDYEIDFKLGGASEQKIDKFLSSLRGLIAAFKYSPILPIKNHYLNTVHKITAVALSNITISTIPNFPFALSVDIELLNFNHAPFLPMIKDFNQAIHWGKYRQYMGKAAGAMHQYVNETFLMKTSKSKTGDIPESLEDEYEFLDSQYAEEGQVGGTIVTEAPSAVYANDIVKFNVTQEWNDGNHIVFYVPAEAQTKIFLPDTASFRTEQEEAMTDLGQNFWDSLLSRFGIDINQSASYGISLTEVAGISESSAYSKSTANLMRDSLDILLAGVNTDDVIEKTYSFLVASFLQQNDSKLTKAEKDWLKDYDDVTQAYPNKGSYSFNSLYLEEISLVAIKLAFRKIAREPSSFLDFVADQTEADIKRKTGLAPDTEQVKQDVARAFNVTLYERFFKSGPIQALMEAAREKAGAFQFNEWEVPMLKVELDPKAVVVNGVTVTMANNFAKMQVQMLDEPSYQHIGGKDSYINISMTVVGEKELIKIKNMFDHINGLARLEHATGVIGFMGIKNIISALSGIKYVLPLNYRVNTIPNTPHVYSVELSLVDFDIFQQTREKLSSKQQKELVDHFSKRNPFLRIKQLWASFNAYPDFPLAVRNDSGEVVGHLDPDFYFRSFEMFDRDVINSVTDQTPRAQNYTFDEQTDTVGNDTTSNISSKILEWLRLYRTIGVPSGASGGANITLPELLKEMVEYYRTTGLSYDRFLAIFDGVVSNETEGFTTQIKTRLLTEFMDLDLVDSEDNSYLTQVNPAPFEQGDLSPNSLSLRASIEAMLSGEYSIKDEEYVSFDPDDVDFHKLIHTFPAADEKDVSEGRIPATCITAIGTHFGYIDRLTGRFYLTVDGANVKVADGKRTFKPNYLEDTQSPDKGNTLPNTGVPGVKAYSEYQNPYESGSIYSQMEKMMVDTSYRDISGRMIRAFPTYMLWLIDEGGYFAGVKLFDNFYGLQSVVDFSVVSSEDLLGDTLILRVSNMYSKLTTPESSKIFSPETGAEDSLTLLDGIEGIIDRTLNVSRNIMGHMRNEYIVDIANIRLKPGVRVHLRVGYGSNPNSLQTVFNGVITNVEPGEIVTITAQSDAIELGAVVNSTSKKGDSGKIDGGVETGLWMSEPRDLMVRLLSMGASRFREAISRSQRGMVFSENRFGIRHFGSILYEPLNKDEQEKQDAIRENISGAMVAAGSNGSFAGKSWDIAWNSSFNARGNTLDAMSQMWANFSSDVDLEIFKRNIYPGNGTGIAQFLGNDLDDGWLSLASLTDEDRYNERLDGHLGRLSDVAWNRLVVDSQNTDSQGANDALDSFTDGNKLIADDRAGIVKGAFSITAGLLGGPVFGAGLHGILRGRGGTNIFRTLGIVSPNADDDIPGFDEISFRAQTYMRTVWDMFQTCARLLPNYIVAIRPFEDRSTVFYGKPHWLYTSGVVPVTTGFPSEEKAIELGIQAPKTRAGDMALSALLDSINRASNPLADYSAFFESFELNDTFQSISEQITSSTGIYAPTSRLSGKVLDFYSQPAVEYTDLVGNVLAKMPKTKGMVNIGLHLPVAAGKDRIDDYISSQAAKHIQLSNLPPRYRFPFYSVTEELVLEESPEIALTPDYSLTLMEGLIVESGELRESEAYAKVAGYNSLRLLGLEELRFFVKEETRTLYSTTGDKILLDSPLPINALMDSAQNYFPNSEIVRMPYPNITSSEFRTLSNNDLLPSQVDEDASFEYQPGIYGQLTYTEWGTPATPEDEQFYIAMRWPYKPPKEEIHERFQLAYGFEGLYGTAENYKKRKVLVYNPANGRAVVCRPAYFMWGESDDTDAIVSPDAAYFLGIITRIDGEDDLLIDQLLQRSGFRLIPQAQECYMGFVPDDVPVGVVADLTTPVTGFRLNGATSEGIEQDQEYLIGFGRLSNSEEAGVAVSAFSAEQINALESKKFSSPIFRDSLSWYRPDGGTLDNVTNNSRYGGNVLAVSVGGKSYFETALAGEYEALSRDTLMEMYNLDIVGFVPDSLEATRAAFVPVFSLTDLVGVQAASYYNEGFDSSVNVIAGDGRSMSDADNIWNEFRFMYHTFESVKRIFMDTYGLDPESEDPFPPYLSTILNGEEPDASPIKKFNLGESTSALDEFAVLLGSDYIASLGADDAESANGATQSGFVEALEYARETWIDAPLSQGGLVEYFNGVITKQLRAIYKNFLSPEILQGVMSDGESDQPFEFDITSMSPKKLFFIMVGIFRQRLWEDAYARAWLVLKPDRKREFLGMGVSDKGKWSFKPVDKIFREFINPYNDIAKPSNRQKFTQLLAKTASEGNSSTDIIIDAVEGIGNFIETNVGPIWTAIADGLSGLLNMFKLNMQQMGYALSEVGNFGKQANILNKVLNDSIYYSLGRPGSILRAVDNPFTREYGEPVIEIREPFQRLHYLSSFSHILTNQIQENLNNVATVVTAVSDGKYPVTVALDKGAPAERQVEKTVETGIFFDNVTGSGFTGFLHPLFHPFETIRGSIKNITGTPDELSARRIALAHLKESIKDIYGGELMIMGNADIRPHDLVYLADVYERMYGLFEVEQVVHHFTPELGFVTAVTPNALVCVNDPSRWFISSWIDSWMNVQTIRNDTRMYLDKIRSGNSGIAIGGDISIDALGEALNAQITGGLQYTHGSTALAKDLIANQVAQSLPGSEQQLIEQASRETSSATKTATVGMALAGVVPIVGPLAWKGWKWVRDNVLDQHGCYVQYLNKNGQPMDAGLSYNQGMVVGRYHSKALLPGILGVRKKVRTPEGYAYVRSDDIFRSLGWQEKEIKDLVRYTSYENALVHARVLKLAGLGPEKAGLQQQFKIICRVTNVVDGDTIDVVDCLSSNSTEFRIRFDGIDTAELNDVKGYVEYSEPGNTEDQISIIDTSTPGGAAKIFTKNAILDKIIILRVNPSRDAQIAPTDDAYDAGSPDNNSLNWQRDIFATEEDPNSGRVVGTIFYYLPPENIAKLKLSLETILRTRLSKDTFSDELGFQNEDVVVVNSLSVTEFKDIVKSNFYDASVFYVKFENLYESIDQSLREDFYDYDDPNDLLSTLHQELRRAFSICLYMRVLEEIYDKASEWPLVSWDEYYENGYPVTLNWELVINNLAGVYVKALQIESDSTQDANETAGLPSRTR